MAREAGQRLLDVIAACEAIQEFVSGKIFADYEKDHLLRSAVERQFEIVGEALNHAGRVNSTLAARIPEFHRIIGLRNRLIHGYDSVDDELLWDVVQSKLSLLKDEVEKVLSEDSESR